MDCASEVKSRMAIGNDSNDQTDNVEKSVSIDNPLRLMKALVCQVATHGCKTWTLKGKHIQASENKCIRKLLIISLTKPTTTDSNSTHWREQKVNCLLCSVILNPAS